jgi:ankyrin repeat domain-containing protein 50
MDGLSSAASVIAVLQIAKSIGSALKDYYEGVRDAREDIQKLYDAVKSLESILNNIGDIINRRDGQHMLNSGLFTDALGPLQQCKAELKKLRLDLETSPKAKGQRSLGRAIQILTWPFKKSDVEKAMVAIERHKSSLVLEVGLETLYCPHLFPILTDTS